MQKIKNILLVSIIVTCLASCASTSHTPQQKQVVSRRGQIGLSLEHLQYNMNCMLRIWKNKLIVLSVTPAMGIEMLRVEATPESILVIDKLNKRYAVVTYNELKDLTQKRITYNLLQFILLRTNQEIQYDIPVGSRTIHLTGKLMQREHTGPTDPQYLKLAKYKQVTLQKILPL